MKAKQKKMWWFKTRVSWPSRTLVCSEENKKKKQKLSETEENNHASNKTRNTWDGALRAKQQPYHTLSQGEKHTS